MRVERIARDKVRIFISYDDLAERGIDRDEIWHNGKKVQELFWDMMETAYVEVGFEIAGPIAVEAFTMPTEGVVVIVTRIPSIPGTSEDDEDEEDLDDAFPGSLDAPIVVRFHDFEELIRAAHTLAGEHLESSLYRYKDEYHLTVDDPLVMEMYQRVWAILLEYGDPSPVTPAVLAEYGTPIFERHALTAIVHQFPL